MVLFLNATRITIETIMKIAVSVKICLRNAFYSDGNGSLQAILMNPITRGTIFVGLFLLTIPKEEMRGKNAESFF